MGSKIRSLIYFTECATFIDGNVDTISMEDILNALDEGVNKRYLNLLLLLGKIVKFIHFDHNYLKNVLLVRSKDILAISYQLT